MHLLHDLCHFFHNFIATKITVHFLFFFFPSSEQLFAKELSVRGSAAAALKALAKQCSDPGAVEKLTAHLFTVLAGK